MLLSIGLIILGAFIGIFCILLFFDLELKSKRRDCPETEVIPTNQDQSTKKVNYIFEFESPDYFRSLDDEFDDNTENQSPYQGTDFYEKIKLIIPPEKKE